LRLLLNLLSAHGRFGRSGRRNVTLYAVTARKRAAQSPKRIVANPSARAGSRRFKFSQGSFTEGFSF